MCCADCRGNRRRPEGQGLRSGRASRGVRAPDRGPLHRGPRQGPGRGAGRAVEIPRQPARAVRTRPRPALQRDRGRVGNPHHGDHHHDGGGNTPRQSRRNPGFDNKVVPTLRHKLRTLLIAGWMAEYFVEPAGPVFSPEQLSTQHQCGFLGWMRMALPSPSRRGPWTSIRTECAWPA